ncbi:TPA: hypothetical protein DEP90_01015 [Patescibacteria group bacterium]|nr:hypothetical protein [Patescibacteria group bacterium]
MIDIGFNDIKEIFSEATKQGDKLESFNSDTGTFDTLQIGVGDLSFKIDEQGLWLGADKFEDSSFNIDMSGNVYMKASGGTSYLLLDSENSKIVVNNGTEDVITIGKQVDDSYGIDFANGVLEGAWIVAESITADQIQTNAIITRTINAEAITTAKIDAEAVTTTKIDAEAVTTAKIDAEAVTTAKIDAEAVTAAKIDANTITANEIHAKTITAGEITDLSLTNSLIANTTIEHGKIASVSATTISTGTLYVGTGSKASAIILDQADALGGNAYLRWSGGSQMWVDGNEYMGFRSEGERYYFYTGVSGSENLDLYIGTTINANIKLIVGALTGTTANTEPLQVGSGVIEQHISLYGYLTFYSEATGHTNNSLYRYGTVLRYKNSAGTVYSIDMTAV